MTHAEIIESMKASGATVRRLDGGKASIVGEVAPETVEAIKADREGFLLAWDRYERDRYCVAPPADIPLRRKPPGFRRDVTKRVHGYVMAQAGEVGRWVLLRGEQYKASRPDWTDAEAVNSACADVIHWQLGRHKAPEQVLVALEESLVGVWPQRAASIPKQPQAV